MKSVLIVMAAAGLIATGAANAADSGADVVKAKGCTNCHAADTKKVGPSFKDIAAKHKDDKDAANTLTTKLKEGKGHMKVAASDAEVKSAVQYMLSTK